MGTTQFAFAGHNRPADLGHHPSVIEALNAAFALIREAVPGETRLLTGLASGADELAVEAWRQAGLGPIHAIFPFLDDPHGARVGPDGLVHSATWLDGQAAETNGRNPHLKQTRLVVETAHMLVVVWTGERARGAGGTADAVRCALELGLPVFWIKPAEADVLRLIRSEKLPFDFDFADFQEALEAGSLAHVEIATLDNLRDVLRVSTLAVDEDDRRHDEALEDAPRWPRLDALLHRTLWRTYGVFRRWMGGKVTGIPAAPPVPADLAGQPGFALLTEAYQRADHRANRLAAVHRSEQIFLVLAMITAAFVGTVWVIWPEFKITGVAIELWLALAALWVWSSAAGSRQHERWGEERRMAEHMRLERAGWALGVSLLGARQRNEQELSEVRPDILFEAGLPEGRFDADRVQRWGAWAMSELVDGQRYYHRATSVRDKRIAHRLHVLENSSFVLLLVSLAGYLVLYWSLKAAHIYTPKLATGLVVMIGTVVPAMAAAVMALEAKLEFDDQSARSTGIANRLDALAGKLGAAPSFEDLQGAARTAMRWHLAEASKWGEGIERRRLYRP